MSALTGVMWMGSGKSCIVNTRLWFQPLRPFASHLDRPDGGRWQSTQVATVWWLAFCQASYCGFMMWQFTQARGSVLRYDAPSA